MIEKKFKYSDLIISPHALMARCQQIEKISQTFDFIPATAFLFEKDELIYRQQILTKKHFDHKPSEVKYKLLIDFAKKMDELSETGFVHGDIKRSNVIYFEDKLWLVDLEPSLRQRRKGRITLIYTPPYISLNDLKHDRLSQESDKIGFYFFIQKFFEPTYRIKNVKTIMLKRTKEKVEILPVPEKEMLSKSYSAILDYVLKHYFL
jgi:hypothetical protein